MNGAPIILFDAKCVLCSANAQFVLKHDRSGYFRLAPIQGEVGAALCRAHGMDPRNPSSLLVVTEAGIRQDSDAGTPPAAGEGEQAEAFGAIARRVATWLDNQTG